MDINLTDSALDRIQTLLESPDKKGAFLRIYIVGGGCSGFQYGFKLEQQNPNLAESNPNFTESTAEEFLDEIIIEKIHQKNNIQIPIKIIIDSLSYQYLEGSTIDYIENLQGARFKVDNPKAETTCGCGSSFSLKEEQQEEH